ncbi:MAG: hypothetical protein V3V08_08545 [Nannocystaceae bacterium]
MRVTVGTWLWLAAACVSSVLLYADPWDGPGVRRQLVATGPAARRLFPELGNSDPTDATIELQRPNGTRLRLVPHGAGGHQLLEGDMLLGPVEREALEGLWASLRMATTLRSVTEGTEVGAGEAGLIRLVFSDRTLVLKLGRDAPDGAGVYGLLEHEGNAAWVVESDLVALIEQPARAWLERRLLDLDPHDLLSVAWDGVVLTRAADDIWRLSSDAAAGMLSNSAVDRRIDALFSSSFDPVPLRTAAPAESLRPWLVATDREGKATTLALGDTCPHREDARLVNRGPGWLGCIDEGLTEVWPFEEPRAGLIEPRLVPYAYGRVLAIEQLEPRPQRLKRRSGGWVLEEAKRQTTVSESEVFRWYGLVRGLFVEPMTPAQISETEFVPDQELVLETDTTQSLHIRCQAGAPLVCTRDGGPPRRVTTDQPVSLAYSEDTFADRRLVSFSPPDVMAIELTPGAGRKSLRQSARQDFGVWRLDYPRHPDGATAVDQVRLESLLAAFANARAEAWVDEEDEEAEGQPERTLRAELRPNGSAAEVVSLAIYPGCRAVASSARRVAKLHASACVALLSDILFDDPIRGWLDRAARLDLESAGTRTVLRRQGNDWVAPGDVPVPRVVQQIPLWQAWRTKRLRSGSPITERLATLRIHSEDGVSSVTVEVGSDWARLGAQSWYYEMETADPNSRANP